MHRVLRSGDFSPLRKFGRDSVHVPNTVNPLSFDRHSFNIDWFLYSNVSISLPDGTRTLHTQFVGVFHWLSFCSTNRSAIAWLSSRDFISEHVVPLSECILEQPFGHGPSSRYCHANKGSVNSDATFPITVTPVPKDQPCSTISWLGRRVCPHPFLRRVSMEVP
jgi:hypothetical protein